MTPFTNLTSDAIPILRDNVDTDAIIPSREIRSTGKTGLKDGLFAPWRYLDVDMRTPDLDFPLNDPALSKARIIIGGANFGCGSSREHAVWALAEYGIRCIIAESFGAIFEHNCIRNGLLPIVLQHDQIATLIGREIAVDLHTQTAGGFTFQIGSEAKAMLIKGLEAIDLTLTLKPIISKWHMNDRKARPWVYL